MSILESIKGERKLSFDCWRYRLLHWTFNVKDPDPKRPQDTGMPKFLYTHFCPLFHLTNLIAILSPLILCLKIAVVIFKAIGYATRGVPWGKMKAAFNKLKLKRNQDVHVAAYIPTAEDERLMAIKDICEWESGIEFIHFWNARFVRYNILKQEDVEKIFNETMPKVMEARKRAKARKDKLRERMIFWTNFSRVFIKWSLNAFYIGLVMFVLYGLYLVAGPAWDLVSWIASGIYSLFTDEVSLGVLWAGCKIALWGAVFIGITYALCRLGWIQRFADALLAGLSKLCPPFYLVGYLFGWIGSGFRSVKEFVSMFYEENCPPIVLVSSEESLVEAVAEKET